MRAALIAALLVAACSPEPDYTVDGLAVFVNSNAPFVRAPDFEDNLRAEVRYARAYWSLGDLDGWQVALVDGLTSCGTPGCAHPEGKALDVSMTHGADGRELESLACSSLVHELGHIRFRDPEHADALWGDVRDRCR